MVRWSVQVITGNYSEDSFYHVSISAEITQMFQRNNAHHILQVMER